MFEHPIAIRAGAFMFLLAVGAVPEEEEACFSDA